MSGVRPPEVTPSRLAPHDEPPPRIPYADQRLIRVTALLALAGVAASATALISIDPRANTIVALGVTLLFGATVGLLVAPVLLVESYRRHPGQWRGRRRRALRRSGLLGALVAGYAALRVAGVGSLTGLVVAALLLLVAEAALTRGDDTSV